MGTYVVGDIHGCFDEWMRLKEKIEFQDENAEFILVGDIVDRGPKTYEMLTWAMENISLTGKYQMVMGNHEREKLYWLKDYFKRKEELAGIGFSLKEMAPDRYDFHEMCIQKKLSDEQLLVILQWFEHIPYYQERLIKGVRKKQRFIIVHASLPEECISADGSFRKKSIAKYKHDAAKAKEAERLKKEMVWERNHWKEPVAKNTIVVHGHTPTISKIHYGLAAYIGKIFYEQLDINVDCGMVYRIINQMNGNLAALRLEDLEEFYAKPINEATATKSRLAKESLREMMHISLPE